MNELFFKLAQTLRADLSRSFMKTYSRNGAFIVVSVCELKKKKKKVQVDFNKKKVNIGDRKKEQLDEWRMNEN